MIHPIIRYADGHEEPLQILGFCGLEVDGKSYSLEELQELLGKPNVGIRSAQAMKKE